MQSVWDIIKQMDTKQIYRREALRLRSQLTPDESAKLSGQIFEKFVGYIKLHNFKSIHIYISYNNEPDTYTIIEYLLANGYEVCVPYIRGEIMHTSRLQKMDFVNGKYGIPEPKIIDEVQSATHYDLIVVPTLAYDTTNNRLGYGKGFYDRFLATQPHARKIGLSYSFNKVDELPTDKYDIPLYIVITENPV